MNVEVLTGPQGGGKSTVMRNEAIAHPGLYLFALPTIELIEEQSADFFKDAPWLQNLKVHGESGPGGVAKRLTAAAKDFAVRGIIHGVIFITHETLMSHDLQGFHGWHARVDEAPAAVQAGRFNIGFSLRSGLKDIFEVVGAPNSEWSSLKLKPHLAKPDWKAVQRDQGSKGLTGFIKEASQPERVFIKADSWDAADDIDWFSMWTPLSLSQFASVQIAGSSYTDSVGYKAARFIYDDLLSFTEREIEPPRTGQPVISIHYFTDSHESSTKYWSESEGRLSIKLVCDHLGKHVSDTGYWSGNEVVQHLMEHRIDGTMIKPMAMGLNKHRHAQDCAFIFSGKATPNDVSIKAVFELSDNDIRHAREDDAVAQFVMRGAIRDPSYSGPYTIYLYSKSQAERLAEHLEKIGFLTVDLVPLDDAGLMETARPEPKRVEATPEEREARKAERAKKAAARAKKNRDAKKAAAKSKP